MTRFFRMCIGAILLALVFNIGIVCAAEGDGIQADLNVSKVVSSTAPYEIDDEVTWVVTLWNNGPGNATNITVAEDVSGLIGLQNINAVASLGEYDTTTNLWNISVLENATFATLTLTTNFSSAGEKVNTVAIIALNEMDPNGDDNSANATAEIEEKKIIPPEEPTADLSISKMVSSTGPYDLDDEVIWVVTLWNNGPDNATNITVAENLAGLTELQDLTAVASLGDYNSTTNLWNITELENATSANLTIITVFDTEGTQTNNVDILHLDQTNHENRHAYATVVINNAAAVIPDQPLSVNLTIRPTTLNLKSNGVFTVYVTLAGFAEMAPDGNSNKPRIDYASSSLTCSEAEMIRASVSNKDGGTLIAKFHRQDLENVTAGNGVQINCSGNLSVNGETINVEGSDTIRVIGEKSEFDKIFSQLWKFLGISKDDVEITEEEDGNVTLMISLNPDDFRNFGQVKKTLKAQDTESAAEADNETELSDETLIVKEKGKPSKNNGNTNQIKVNNANIKSQKGNNSANERDDESAGKSNGKNK